jgi:hypothetical protein
MGTHSQKEKKKHHEKELDLAKSPRNGGVRPLRQDGWLTSTTNRNAGERKWEDHLPNTGGIKSNGGNGTTGKQNHTTKRHQDQCGGYGTTTIKRTSTRGIK